MKNKMLFFLGVLSLIMLQATLVSQNFIPSEIKKSDIPPGMTEIDLQGTLDVNPGPNTFEAYADADFVYIYFYQNYGYVNIVIMTESGGTIYDNTINTAVQSTCIIPTTGFITGRYTLFLNNANGYAEGDFIKQ